MSLSLLSLLAWRLSVPLGVDNPLCYCASQSVLGSVLCLLSIISTGQHQLLHEEGTVGVPVYRPKAV